MSNDRMEKQLEVKAPVSRVWRAITDHREFGQWFKTTVETPFVVGKVSKGQITYPGYEHFPFEVFVVKMEPERVFAFRWGHMDAATEKLLPGNPQTLVEFTLTPTPAGTLVTIVESGFENLPPEHRERAFTGNASGWAEQLKNIERHVSATP